ncbi:adenosylcobinamide amidohydrolase [Zoogloea sp.]|uniref:adenosylcobinamide amidohydrolase n=1 Tax=Zoogloea sp. TaxID=49181 RepID=UPI0026060F51|nr:adenosylcobinamide amidohydrolase [Zoogloea sp.]MDD3354236.1 adenosylcobinamide amidohydrolase [Zoogloea sp.]
MAGRQSNFLGALTAVLWTVLTLALGAWAMLAQTARAESLTLPDEVAADARVERQMHDGLWEKTLIVRFPEPRRTLSTSDGLLESRAAINHGAHPTLWQRLSASYKGENGQGGKAYAEDVVSRTATTLGLPRDSIARMATAADMDNLAVVTRRHGPLTVTVLATAGAKSNAIRTGVDEGRHIEGQAPAGTINILVLSNVRLTDAALARALITVTEGKTAALEDLRVPSTYTAGVQATGTGTDSIIVVSGTGQPTASYTGGHSRIGELIGKATYQAVVDALGRQNGFFLPGTRRFEDPPAALPKPAGHLRLALLHLDPVPGEIAANRARIEAGIREAVRHGADWVVTPELAETGYNFARRVGTSWIAPFPDTWMSSLAALARDNRVALFVGFAERDPRHDTLHNSVAVIDRSGQILGAYRKQRVHGGAESWSVAGNDGQPFQVDGIPVGVLICADTYAPEPAARLRAQGAALLLVPANWPPVNGMGPGDVWERRSAETGLPVIVNNRTGREPELDFTAGESILSVAGRRQYSFSTPSGRMLLVDWDRADRFTPLTSAIMPIPGGTP